MAESPLGEKLLADQKVAMKAKDSFRLSVIRMLRAELQNSSIAKNSPLDSDEELAVLTREVKRRKDSMAEYEKSARQDLVDDLKKEIEILSTYLPEQLSEEELEQMVLDVIAEKSAETMRDMGKVMGSLMPRIKGKADGDKVRQIVEKNLQ